MTRKLRWGLVQVYTGDGKGKTTAALGLALRAAGAGLKVYICQFIKGAEYSENKALKKIKNIKVEQCGRGCFIRGKPDGKDVKAAERGLEKARECVSSGRCDVVILDEVNIALKLGLLRTGDVIDMIRRKPAAVEIVLTGRCCPSEIIDAADLVTEMKEIKHPYRRGIKARIGIEC